jgi:catechol 2,3-dioxygenase-like lactoylglutathione lyase family enzyme
VRIEELTLQTRHLADQKAFYRITLGLSLLTETADSFTVQAGATRLRFQQVQQDALYHIAFTIPRNTLALAKRWTQERVPLLHTKEGADEIFFEGINARSFYFCDADDNILEFIVHYSLEQETEEAFGPSAILHVSEIGLPVEDVLQLAARLKEQLDLIPYPPSRPISPAFAFIGDINGQLVVVKASRPWLPTGTVLAAVAPVQLTISGQKEQQIQLAPYPYTIAVTASYTTSV